MPITGLPGYQLTVYSPTSGTVLRIFDSQSFSSLHYDVALNDIGKMVLTFDTAEDLSPYFPLDALIDIERSDPVNGGLVKEETYFCRLTHRLREGDQEQYIVGGLSLNHLIARRVVNPDDDPLEAGGYSTKAGAADDVMRAYAIEQMVMSAAARQFPDLTVATVAGVGISVGKRLRYENLFEVLQDLAARGGVDFRIERTLGRRMTLYIELVGNDKTYTNNYPVSRFILLDPQRGNLANPSLLIDRKDEKNFGYFLGKGPGSQRIKLELAGSGTTDSPWNRIEYQDDLRQAERGDALQLLTDARSSLKEEGYKVEFSFDMTGQLPGNSYRVDWIIGDKITAEWMGTRVDLRIISVEFELSSAGESMSINTELL